jgi:putative glutamine amidotransferase
MQPPAPVKEASVTHHRPVVLVSCDLRGFGTLKYQTVFERYVDALVSAFDCTPLLMPALGASPARQRHYVELADGALLTGSISDVGPEFYGEAPQEELRNQDPQRDGTTLPFVREAIAANLPLMGICRGLQEINVALGGTLHQRVHECPGRRDHRSPEELPFPERYLPAHPLHVKEGGWLERVLLARNINPSALSVNSQHGQAAKALGKGVVIEAIADDGTIEAIHVPSAPALAFGVQWHAEWYVETTPLHNALFKEFERACHQRVIARARRAPPCIADLA